MPGSPGLMPLSCTSLATAAFSARLPGAPSPCARASCGRTIQASARIAVIARRERTCTAATGLRCRFTLRSSEGSNCTQKRSDASNALEEGKEHHREDDHPGDRDGGRDQRGAGPLQPQEEPGEEHAKQGDDGENPETPEYRP